MEQDGNCLFRAVADQVYGDQEMHAVVRSHCMDYIVSKIMDHSIDTQESHRYDLLVFRNYKTVL